MSSKAMIYAGIAIGVAALAASIVYGTDQQQQKIGEEAVLAPAAHEGSFSSPTGLGAQLNKEKWHEDPFGDIAQKVRDEAGK